MLTGAQVLAPCGFRALAQGVSYYFLTNNPRTSQVLFVRFHWEGRGHPGAFVISVPRSDFESGLEEGAVVVSSSQSELPPWLESLRGQNLAAIDAERLKAAKSHYQRIESRLLLITPALDNLNTILASDSIEAEINSYARRASLSVIMRLDGPIFTQIDGSGRIHFGRAAP